MRFSTKISLSILIVGLAALALSLYAVYAFNYVSVTDSELIHTANIAKEISAEIHYFLDEKVKTALTLANTPIIRNALRESNALYGELASDRRRKRIEQLNAKWKSIDDENDPFVLTYTDSRVARFLKRQQQMLEGEYGEIFLTNKYGALVASTSKLTTLAHGHKYWWLGAYEDGAGKVFLDDRGFDDSVDGYVLGLVAPVKEDKKIIGILKCNLNILSVLKECISVPPDGHHGQAKLARSGGMIVLEAGQEPLSTHVEASVYATMKNHPEGAVILEGGGSSYMVGLSQVNMTTGGGTYGFGGTFESIDHKKGNRGESWIVLCYRPMARVLAPIHEAVKGILLIGIIIVVVMILVSRILSGMITKPIHIMEAAFKRIEKGEFDFKVEYKGKDEFKDLSESLNHMVSELARTTTSVEHLENEVHQKEVAESELKQREALLKSVIDTDPNCIFLKDQNGRFLLVNRTMAELHDTTPDDMVGKADRDFLENAITSAKEVDHFIQNDREVISKKEIKVIPEERFTCSDGTVKWFRTTKVPIFIEGSGECLLGVAIDITHLKDAEENLRKIEKRNQALLDHSPVCHKIVDLDLNLQYMSGNGFKMLKLDANADVYGKPYPFDFFPSAFRKEMTENLEKVKKTADTITMEALARDIEGNDVWLYSTLVPVLDDDGKIDYITVVSDNTTQRKLYEKEKLHLEEQLNQALKMEAIGNLAGGIAHDFNNILSPIMVHTEMALMDLPKESPLHNSLEQIYKACERARDLVQQILGFARKQKADRVEIRVSLIVKEAVKFLRSTIPSTISIHYDIDVPRDIVFADPTQLNQIIMNLCTNAAHAMEEKGGRLEVILENDDLDSDAAQKIVGLDAGYYLKLTVRDTGHGIDPELLGKIFEPYFTTKPIGKGTGMGLALVHGIVKSYGGEITVQSGVGKGTAFHVYLPLVESKSQVVRTSIGMRAMPKGNERILFVDDEMSAVNGMQPMLEKLGYIVEARTSSLEALELFSQKPDGFDIVITDMTMPNMTGKELAREMMSIRSDIPIILCTGYSEQIGEKRAKDMGIRGFVMKPIVMREMARKIREVLDGEYEIRNG